MQPPPPAARRGWVVLPFVASGVDPQTASTFRGLLVGELPSAGVAASVSVLDVAPCSDIPCAVEAGRLAGAEVAIFGTMSQLGKKIVVSTTAVTIASGSIRSSGKLTAERVEELDTLAGRFAAAISGKVTAEETAELGNITDKEAQVDTRREGQRGLSLRAGALLPLVGYGGEPGVSVDIGYWFEARDFAIEPRFGLHFDVGQSDAGFWEIPFDLSAYYLFSKGDIAPFAGGGGGLRYQSETTISQVKTGRVLVVYSDRVESQGGWGFGAFARGGVMFFRTYAMRVSAAVDYNITLVDLKSGNPQAIGFSLSVMF